MDKLPMLPEDFKAKMHFDTESGCALWRGALSGKGYGSYSGVGKHIGAHQFAYETFKGAVAPGLELDHLCKNRDCVNPYHLEPVTHRINMLRSGSFVARNARKTHCPVDHELKGANVIVHGGKRKCRKCRNARMLALYYANRPPLKPHRNTAKTHCKRGHALSGENLVLKKSGARNCRTCANEAQRLRYHRE